MVDRDTAAGSLSLERFQELLDRWGADLTEWPEIDRKAAEILITGDPTAGRLLAQAERLDELLRESPAIAASPALKARILEAAPGHAVISAVSTRWENLWPFGPIWRPAMALACAAFLGIVVGIADPIMLFTEENSRAASAAGVTDEMVVITERQVLGLQEVE